MGPALHTDGTVDPDAWVANLTGLLRNSSYGDGLAGWPADMRVLARRTPAPPGDQVELHEDPIWRHGAHATNTPPGRPSGSTSGTAPKPTSRTRSRN